MDESVLKLLGPLIGAALPGTANLSKSGSTRREILESLRPFLGKDRQAALDRILTLLRVLELTQIIRPQRPTEEKPCT